MNWIQLLYQYGVGGIFFFFGLYICFKEKGALLDHPEDRLMLWALLAGFFGYLVLNILWIILAGI